MTGFELIVIGTVVVVLWWALLALALLLGWRIATATFRRSSNLQHFVHSVMGETANRLAGELPRSYRG